MIYNLTVVHALLVLASAACIYLVVRELRRAYVSQWRLFAPGSAALVVAGILFLAQIGAGQPLWAFVAAAVVGFVIGWIRGMMIGLVHDAYRPQVIVSPNAKLSLLGVALGVGVCTALEIFGAIESVSFEKLRLWAALSAMVCAVAMLARALVLTVRLHRHT